MSRYQLNEEEQQFLAQYDIGKYERPSVATDMVILSILGEGEQNNFRKLPQKELKVLLIKRGKGIFKDKWALPGGFCKMGEDIYETAKRELYEETNVQNAYLNPAGIFGDVGRDPRGWIISHTFLALIDGNCCSLNPGTDAKAAEWFTIHLDKDIVKKDISENAGYIETDYKLTLLNGKTDSKLFAVVREYRSFADYHENVKYEIMECEGIAFDHAKLMVHALLFLQKSLQNDVKLVFDLMPEFFTLTQLQNAIELILGEKLLTANFRRKINEYVLETEKIIEGAGHRPARLFKRNVNAFYK